VLDERLADRAEGDRERRDAELHGTDEADGAVHDPERDPRAAVTAVGQLAQARAPRRHERVLGRNEERVPQHEQENHDDAEEFAHAPLSGA
jgi:hypothetical protein